MKHWQKVFADEVSMAVKERERVTRLCRSFAASTPDFFKVVRE
jgi:hypothetical protein